MSRNKREGRYAGKFRGQHVRQTGIMIIRKKPRSVIAMREYSFKCRNWFVSQYS